MENWIGIGVWIVMGAFIALVMRAAIKRPEETPGHAPVLACPNEHTIEVTVAPVT